MNSRKTIFAILIMLLPLTFVSCKSSEGYKNQKQYERKMARESKKAGKELKKLRKAHMDNQSDQTKEMMKQSRKKAKEINRFRRK